MNEDEPGSGPSLSHQSIEAHEDFIQHIEKGQKMLRTLSMTTLVVAAILAASYFSQILEPFVTGQRYVQVDLQDPGLLVLEIVILGLTFAWLYVGAVNYLFYTRVSRQIKAIRALEREMEKGIVGK
jgi:hypothetical protein